MGMRYSIWRRVQIVMHGLIKIEGEDSVVGDFYGGRVSSVRPSGVFSFSRRDG